MITVICLMFVIKSGKRKLPTWLWVVAWIELALNILLGASS